MKCLRCLNENPSRFFQARGRWYCADCMDFGLLEAGKLPVSPGLKKAVHHVTPHLEFEMTPFQKSVSAKALSILQSGRDVLIYAAAGAGKTEISLESIAWYLSQGKKVCFAISRRQVVIEIAKRLRENFPDLSVIEVCQGYTEITDADLIVCTTHQLYRYPFCFDLLILDELDAFPYAGSRVLEAIAAQSCTGQRMLLSATPDEVSLQQIEQGKMEMVSLFARPHGKPLSIPAIHICSKPMMVVRILFDLRRFVENGRQVLLFVPRIVDTRWMKWIVGAFFSCGVITSKSVDKDAVMDAFHQKKTEVLLCTTLLERGITVPSVQVVVYRADHPVFTRASLIQIFGRAGRSFRDPYGKCIAYCQSPSRNLLECVRQLEMMNRVSGAGSPSMHAPD